MARLPPIHPVATCAHRQRSAAIAAELRKPAAAATESVVAKAAGAAPHEGGRARRSTRCAAPILSLTAVLAAEGAPLAVAANAVARVPAALRLLRAPPRILQAAAAAAPFPKFGLSCGRTTRATGRRTGRSGGDRRNAHGAAAAWWRPRRRPHGAAAAWRPRRRPHGEALLPGGRLLRKNPKRVGVVGTQGVACNCCCAGRSTRLLQPRPHTADILQLGLGPRPSSDHRSSRWRRPEAKVDPGPAAEWPGRSPPG